jgi:hypothetical protein
MNLRNKLDKFLLNEKKVMSAKDVVKILRSSDFGMTEAGGNGYAYAKGNTLVIHDPYYYMPTNAQLNSKLMSWSPGGTHFDYFQQEYGVTFENVKVRTVADQKKYGPGGYVEITMNLKK